MAPGNDEVGLNDAGPSDDGVVYRRVGLHGSGDFDSMQVKPRGDPFEALQILATIRVVEVRGRCWVGGRATCDN